MDTIVACFGRSIFNSVQRSGESNITHKILMPLITRTNSCAAQVPILGLPKCCALQATMAVIVKGKQIDFLPSGRGEFKFYNFTAICTGFPLFIASYVKTAANAELLAGYEGAVTMLAAKAGLHQPFIKRD